MGFTLDRRRRGVIKPNETKLTRILEQLRATKQKSQDGRIDGRKLPAEDLVWLANDELRRIKEARQFIAIRQKLEDLRADLETARDARDAAEEVERLWDELETDLRSVHVAASLDQGFELNEIDKAKVIARKKKIYGDYEESVVFVLTDDLNKGVNDDGTPNLEKYKKVLTIRFILAAAHATKFQFNIYVVEANSLRFRQNTSKPWPWPHQESDFEKLCREVLIEQLKDIKPVAIFLHSSPARGMFKVKVGEPVFAGRAHLGLEKVGGLDEVAEARGGPILVEGFDHMAQARFFKAFWEWGKIAVELARK